VKGTDFGMGPQDQTRPGPGWPAETSESPDYVDEDEDTRSLVPLRRAGQQAAIIEIERVGATDTSKFRAGAEVWTRNRVYVVDASFVCVSVVERATQTLELDHPLIGARLMGGQVATQEFIETWAPLPFAGTRAVFSHAPGRQPQRVVTSLVERVVLRIVATRVPRPLHGPAESDASRRDDGNEEVTALRMVIPPLDDEPPTR
jgi:hypothetical protein